MGLSLELNATIGTKYNEAIRDAKELCIKLNLDFVRVIGNSYIFLQYFKIVILIMLICLCNKSVI